MSTEKPFGRTVSDPVKLSSSLNPEYTQALNNLGNLLEKKGHFNESELFLRAAVATRPQFASAWMNLGITMMNAGKYNVGKIELM